MGCISFAPIIFIGLFVLVFVFLPYWSAVSGFWPSKKMAKEVREKAASGVNYMHHEIISMRPKSILIIVVYPIAAPCLVATAYPKSVLFIVVIVFVAVRLLKDYVCI